MLQYSYFDVALQSFSIRLRCYTWSVFVLLGQERVWGTGWRRGQTSSVLFSRRSGWVWEESGVQFYSCGGRVGLWRARRPDASHAPNVPALGLPLPNSSQRNATCPHGTKLAEKNSCCSCSYNQMPVHLDQTCITLDVANVVRFG